MGEEHYRESQILIEQEYFLLASAPGILLVELYLPALPAEITVPVENNRSLPVLTLKSPPPSLPLTA
jgi:hypothetical protein